MAEPGVERRSEIDEATLAGAIVKISDAMRKLLASGLNRKAVLVLLAHSTKVSMNTVDIVLDGLDTLKEKYTRRG